MHFPGVRRVNFPPWWPNSLCTRADGRESTFHTHGALKGSPGRARTPPRKRTPGAFSVAASQGPRCRTGAGPAGAPGCTVDAGHRMEATIQKSTEKLLFQAFKGSLKKHAFGLFLSWAGVHPGPHIPEN